MARKKESKKDVLARMSEYQRDQYEEHSAKLEYRAGMTREDAEARALWEIMGYGKQESLW